MEPADADILRFERWELGPHPALAPIFANRGRRGIYVLEFENGEQYVGQSVDVMNRFVSHWHGSTHHPGWQDITGLRFLEIESGDLNEPERAEIRRCLGEEIPLRNRQFVLESVTPSPLDRIVEVEDQEHWSLGDEDACRSDFASNPLRQRIKPGKFKRWAQQNRQLSLYHAVLDDLAFVMENVVPAALETRETYWTLTDFPNTAGGRFAALNTGVLEHLVFPRRPAVDYLGEDLTSRLGWNSHMGCLNVWGELEDLEGDFLLSDERLPSVLFANENYSVLNCTRVLYPVGQLGTLLKSEPDLLLDARELAMTMMRYRNGGLFRRFHSRDLSDDVFRHIVRRQRQES